MLRVETFYPKQNNRGIHTAGCREMSVKIVIERNAESIVSAGVLKDCDIVRAVQSNLSYMNCIDLVLTKDRCGLRSKALIQQQTHQATRSKLRLSSSTVAAA